MPGGARVSRPALAALVAGALALAGCSSPSGTTGGSTPSASPHASGSAVTAVTLGDLRTLDPCSLADPTSFGASAAAAFGDPQSLDYCVLKIQAAGGPVEVHVGEVVAQRNGPSAARGTVSLPGGLQLDQGAPGPVGCQDELELDGGLAVVAAAAPSDGPATTTTCIVADTAARAAAAALVAGRAQHRTYPAHSFGPVDACTVLTSSVVTATLPELATAAPISHPAGHQCEYGASGSAATYAALILAAAYARFDGGPGSTTLTVAGHQVVLVPEQPDGRTGECVGYGPHIAFPSRSGEAAMEMAELHVALPDGASDATACSAVRALARSVFAHLP